MDVKIKDNLTTQDLLAECNAIFNSLEISSTSMPSLSTISSSTTKDKLLTIHGIMKRNETLMEELKKPIEDIKHNIIVNEIKNNMNEIVRMYQDF